MAMSQSLSSHTGTNDIRAREELQKMFRISSEMKMKVNEMKSQMHNMSSLDSQNGPESGKNAMNEIPSNEVGSIMGDQVGNDNTTAGPRIARANPEPRTKALGLDSQHELSSRSIRPGRQMSPTDGTSSNGMDSIMDDHYLGSNNGSAAVSFTTSRQRLSPGTTVELQSQANELDTLFEYSLGSMGPRSQKSANDCISPDGIGSIMNGQAINDNASVFFSQQLTTWNISDEFQTENKGQ